ncbi:ThiS family protein [Mycolicibacterium phlei]|jgi:molybdopterin synthase sulfur carrier subunit|uniref:Molybdopterin synthase sulfur carrier subunit n=1 Tax=Mycolicibacterium phlei DSM 43239 = CCUG 21000 TaxID=1226750 RepID=A0A5N5UUY9_MYCPH|nr:MoaD/ThiS family protein [Mycolicibacterium phlei]VEG07748.1 ThiS family protein [Mycobacteroides chelonae]AMO59619.1 ThiS family protein [Mycolicibacterium phlei]EID10744.1 ThiS family protein [Mycolicibacterium phlei RIVM601174]KAB7753444.1 molybdenum cofactor biosynthesis protein MoaD [Mycolicibacterium phlei DSM 43239 = CCUG 21000]KXW62347.1 molybdenum cofactor biosynthesis protein MoaD [Mycolicibacterium phlei DSM 43239 = CCUG 21000]
MTLPITETVTVTVRFFAAARAAAGNEEETIQLRGELTVADLVARLSERGEELAKVLKRCSFLVDEVAVRNLDTVLRDNQTVDVLPPFAGG